MDGPTLLAGIGEHIVYTQRSPLTLIMTIVQSPTSFQMNLHPTSDTRQGLLHVSSSALSPPFPHPHLVYLESIVPRSSNPRLKQDVQHDPSSYHTTAHLTLEPLLLGVLPQTTLPTVLWIMGVVVISASLVPRIIRYLEAQISAQSPPPLYHKDD